MHGQSKKERKHHRQQERSILILKEDSSALEIVSYDDLMACGTYNAAKEKGLVRVEGKDYVVQDGDIILFRFNV